MSVASRFRTLPETGARVAFILDGAPASAPAGVTVAAALLAHSGGWTRQTATGEPRTAFCMMGVCFDCLVEIDGTPNTQACMTLLREGMTVRRQTGLRGLSGGQNG
jgi:predicted molibdopterin-dependent oxidoreductase YjgC